MEIVVWEFSALVIQQIKSVLPSKTWHIHLNSSASFENTPVAYAYEFFIQVIVTVDFYT